MESESVKKQSPEELSRAWLDAKAAEDTAKERRIEIEEQLIKLLGVKPEGAKTHTVGAYKVTVTAVINRTLDNAIWESIKDKLPPEVRPVTYEPKLDVTGVKWLQVNQPNEYKILAEALTIRPGKVGVKVVPVTKP